MNISKAVIPAAGFGTRFLPVTRAQPKEMMPVLDKPTIQYAVEEAIESEIDDILIITGRGKQSIERHFDNSYELEEELKSAVRGVELQGDRYDIGNIPDWLQANIQMALNHDDGEMNEAVERLLEDQFDE